MNLEASRYLNDYGTARIPYIGRPNSILFVDRLYKKKAMSVVVSAIGINDFIIEMIITGATSDSIKDIILEILKSKPYAIKETSRNVFKVQWKIGWAMGGL